MTPKEKDGPLLGKAPMSGILTPFIIGFLQRVPKGAKGATFTLESACGLIERLRSENAQTILARIPRTGFVGAFHDDV